jgi:hypothetical protein
VSRKEVANETVCDESRQEHFKLLNTKKLTGGWSTKLKMSLEMV